MLYFCLNPIESVYLKSYCTMLHGISSYFALPRDILIKMFVLFYRVTGEGLLLLAVVSTDW